VQAEARLVNYVTTKQTACGVPAEIPKQLKANQARSQQMMKVVCQAAAAPPPPSGPTLSDSLAAPVPDASNIKRGKGTYDTLTGAPIGR